VSGDAPGNGASLPPGRDGVPRHPGRRRPATAPHLLAAAALTIAAVGDAVVYVVIPAAAAVYGLGPVGISLALSVNRFVRVALNPVVAHWLGRVGLRTGAVAGSVVAVATTAAYAVAPGAAALVAARAVWGVTFAVLRLTVLGYATVDAARAPQRLGVALGIHALAPAILLVTAGAGLGFLGPRGVFVALAGFTALAVPFALALPRPSSPRGVIGEGASAPSVPAPASGVVPAAAATIAVAFGVDGVVTAGTVLALLAGGATAVEAAALGGVVLAARKVTQALFAPLGGWAASRWGVSAVVAVAMLVTAAGLAAVALGSVVVGALFAVTGAAVVLTLTPAVLRAPTSAGRLRALGWLTMTRDLGSAAGAAFAPLVLLGDGAAAMAGWTFGGAAALVVVALVVWRRFGVRLGE
jgi:hypothetical protein